MKFEVITKDIYIDPNGKNYYSKEGSRIRNKYGTIKVDDFKAFENEMVKLKDPTGLAEFIIEELDFKGINILTN